MATPIIHSVFFKLQPLRTKLFESNGHLILFCNSSSNIPIVPLKVYKKAFGLSKLMFI